MSDRDRLGPPPVEPMTNAAWTRVERGLFDQLDQPAPRPVPARSVRWPWLAIPAFAVAAAAVVIVLATRGGTPEKTEVAETPEAPMSPSRVVAGDTPSMVSYGDAHLTVDAHAAIVMNREGSSPSVLVERGAVDFTVAPRKGEPYIVRAGDVVVRVIGTQFRVARYEERITVAVERGIVDVQFRGDVHRLTAGQSWTSQEQTASKPDVMPEEDPVPKSNDKPAIGSNGKPAIGSNGKPVTAVDATKVAAEKAAIDEEKAKFYKMAALERRAPEQAMKGYLELAKGNSVWSANALYAAGRLAHDRNDKRASVFLGIYLKRFPSGKNAEDARDLLSRLDGDTK